jgi:tRNA/tmRNA/rRNA uracil-C5-methylase (TrmA/RlmC/RlmD family)
MRNEIRRLHQNHSREGVYSEESIRVFLQATETAMLSIDTSLDNVSQLLEKLPDQASMKTHLSVLQTSLTTVRESYRHAVAHPHDDPNYDTRQKMFVAVFNLESQSDDLHEESDALARDVLNVARQTRSKTEASYERFKRLSYILYFLASVIGLASKLYGKKEVDSPE